MIVFNNDNIKNIEGYSEKILGSESLIEINRSRSRPLKLSKNYIEVINKVSQEIIPESDNFLMNYYKNKYKKSFFENLKNTILLQNIRNGLCNSL